MHASKLDAFWSVSLPPRNLGRQPRALLGTVTLKLGCDQLGSNPGQRSAFITLLLTWADHKVPGGCVLGLYAGMKMLITGQILKISIPRQVSVGSHWTFPSINISLERETCFAVIINLLHAWCAPPR